MPTQFAYFSICSIPAKYANCVGIFLYMFHVSEIRELCSRISLYVLCE